MKARIYHMAAAYAAGGLRVSAICYARARAISGRASWTTRPEAVTCPKCKALLTADQVKTGGRLGS